MFYLLYQGDHEPRHARGTAGGPPFAGPVKVMLTDETRLHGRAIGPRIAIQAEGIDVDVVRVPGQPLILLFDAEPETWELLLEALHKALDRRMLERPEAGR